MSNNSEPNGENNLNVRNSRRDSRAGLTNATTNAEAVSNVTPANNVKNAATTTGATTNTPTPTVQVTGQGQAGTSAAGGGNPNVVTNNNRGTNANTTNQTNNNNVQNPYANVRTGSALKNRLAKNPFADGDGGGDTGNNNGGNGNNNNGRVTLDKSTLDEHTRFLLRHYLDLANPVYETEEVTITKQRRNGETEEIKRTKPVFKGYDFYLIDGQKFEKWIEDNIGAGYKIDPMTKEIYKEGNAVNQTDTQVVNNNNNQQ